jgi:hypothetical protein
MKIPFARIGRIALRILIGILLFFFFVIYIVIPLGAPWLIRSRGSKILSHPVKVRSVWVNPFLLRLSVDKFEILTPDKRGTLTGFDKFWVDFSFLGLCKREYRIESIGLAGLVVNVELLPGNKINLMDLLPASGDAAAAEEKPAISKQEGQAPREKAISAPALPNIRIDSIELTGGTVTFTDRTLTPQFSSALNDLTLTISGISSKPEDTATAVFSVKIDDKGVINAEAEFKPFVQPIELNSTFSMDGYHLAVLTPYAGKYAGHGVKSGRMGLKMDYKISDNKLNARHKLLIQNFDFGEKVESKDALNLPFGLAIALLEDPQGRISISLPVKGDMSDPQFEYWHLVGQVVTNFFMKLVTSPFLSLLSMTGVESGVEEMSSVSFEPGKAELTDKTKEKLTLLLQVIKERPKLFLEINGSYDPKTDWTAIKTEAYTTEFAGRQKESSRSDWEIIKDIYVLHFGILDFWKLAKKFTAGKQIDELAMQQEMKRLIIERGKEDNAALELLADQRARAVYDFIISGGFDSSRVKAGAVRQTQETMGRIPLEFTITVFEAR